MDYLCLGPLEVRVNGVPVDLGEPQQRLVLAVLLSQAGAVVSTDRLVDAIWGEDPPSSARKIVQGYVSGLRRALRSGDVIESRPPGYRLKTERGDVDAGRFGDLVAEASDKIASDPDRARGVLREALAMWHGAPYEDLSDHDALRPEIVRLEALHMTAVQLRIEADIYADDALLAVAELADLTRRHPLEERLWALRMLALYRSGRQAEALRAFDEARRTLAEDVGLEPSTELKILQQRILDQDPVLGTSRALSAEPSRAGATGRNPYKGLRAFEESDAADFCGRDDLVRRLREAIDQRNVPRLVVLAGPSGSGKSSVVRAGLFPMLRSEKWQLGSMYPGTEPIEALESALRGVGQGGSALILVDQLEELLSAGADDADRALFLDRLCSVAEVRDGPWIVATVRTDLLDWFLTHLGFARLVAAGLLLVTPLEEHQVRDIVARPASRVGTVVEPDLTAAIVADVVNRPAALPLLEFALTDLYDRSGGVTLSLEAYRAAGGISGSLVKRAEEMFAGLGADAEETTRQLFLRLVALTEDGEPIRRRRQSSAVVGIRGVDQVLQLFGRHRLLTFDQDQTGQPTVEVAHEALLTQWPRLRNWIDDAQDSIKLHRQLAEAEAEWEAHGRSAPYLLTGPRLDRLLDRTHEDLALTGEEQAFLDVSTAAQRRGRRRRAGIVWSLVVVFAVLAGVAAWQRNTAQHEARQANVRRVAVESTLALTEDPELGILLAREAVDISRRAGEPPLPEAVSALQGAVQASRLEAHLQGGALTVAFSPDGSLLVTDTPALDGKFPTNEVVVWDAVNHVPLRSLLADIEVLSIDNRVESGGAEGRAFAFSPDGRHLAVAYQTAFEYEPNVARNAPIIVWDPTTGEQLARLVTSGWVTWDPTWSADGAFLSVASWDGGTTDVVTTWEVASGREVSSFRPGLVGGLAAYHGDTIAVAQPQAERVGMYDLHTGEEVDSLKTPGLGPKHVAVDLGGDRLVLDGGEELQAWDMASRARQWSRSISSPRAIAVSPDGTTVALGGDGGLIRLLSLDDGAEVMEFAGSVGVGSVAYDPASDLLASVDITGTRLWDVSAGGSPALGAIEIASGGPWVIDFSPDGTEVSLSTSGGIVERWLADGGNCSVGWVASSRIGARIRWSARIGAPWRW